VQATTGRPKITPTADGSGVVSHAGARLLADLADRSTLTGRLSAAFGVVVHAADGARSGPGIGLFGGGDRGWRGVHQRYRHAGRPAWLVRTGGVGLDGVAVVGTLDARRVRARDEVTQGRTVMGAVNPPAQGNERPHAIAWGVSCPGDCSVARVRRIRLRTLRRRA
jgi:hypothetical protein